jgi:hypothetical protein
MSLNCWRGCHVGSALNVELEHGEPEDGGRAPSLSGRHHLTREQLEEQARKGRFSSERARVVWSAIHSVASPDEHGP